MTLWVDLQRQRIECRLEMLLKVIHQLFKDEKDGQRCVRRQCDVEHVGYPSYEPSICTHYMTRRPMAFNNFALHRWAIKVRYHDTTPNQSTRGLYCNAVWKDEIRSLFLLCLAGDRLADIGSCLRCTTSYGPCRDFQLRLCCGIV
jgi:hypothetical protein